MKKHLIICLIIITLVIASCRKESQDSKSELDISPKELAFPGTGGDAKLNVSMTGRKWTVSSRGNWCTTLISSSTIAYVQLKVTALPNSTGNPRSTKLTFVVDSQDSVTVDITQDRYYPDYSDPIAPDMSGMEKDAIGLAFGMFAGWNLGNTLEALGGETAWGNPLATQLLIDSVKAAGINSVRIPCGWNSYIEDPATCKLKDSWLQRVKQVVDYCCNTGMYVILNSHWDGGWLEQNPTYSKQVAVNAKQKAIWEQVARFFRDYDEHLIFAGTNEVHTDSDPVSENFEVQMSYNQTFVDAVRSTGGKNAYRTLLIQAYNTNIDHAVNHLELPADKVTGRLMVEVHYYDPWEFAGLESDASWGTVKYLWGVDFAQYGTISSWGQEDYAVSQFARMKAGFVDHGYPVILGEFGAIRRALLTGDALEHHLESRSYYYRFLTERAKNAGMVPFVWDNGALENLGFGIFNRNDGTVSDRRLLKAYLEGASAGEYPFRK